jgi:hypothetical protein
VGIGGRGGDGGSGGKGGNGGRLVVRGLNVITNELILDQNGGPGGYGAAGGLASYGGSPGLPGGSGVDGGNGSLSIYDANNPMPSPFLWIIHSNNEVTVSWPYPSLGFLLQQNSSISTGNWTNVTQMPFDDGTNRSVTISSPTGSRFFRLHLP